MRGFTLVELTTTLVVLGIVAAFALPKFVDRTGFESRGVYDQAQAVVRYAQKIAIAQRQSPPKSGIFVVISASQVRVCYDAGCTTSVTDPSTGAALQLTAPTGVTLSTGTFSFDGSGSPSFNTQLAVNVNSSGVGDINRIFYVEPVTGYVHP